MAVSGSLGALRAGNRSRVLELLRMSGPMHRADLARRAGLSASTVSTIVTGLIAEGLVREDGDVVPASDRVHRGRAGRPIAINPGAGVAIGLDFSQDRAHAALVDIAQRVLDKDVAELPELATWSDRLDIGLEMVTSLLARAGRASETLRGAGLGIPYPIDLATGTVAVNRVGAAPWAGIRPADELANRLGVPVSLDNTSHLGALGEVIWGAGAGARNVVYVKMSHGVGAGLLLDGRIFRGALGAAGEIGHVSVDDSGPACACGNRGCLEMFVGTRAVLAALEPLRGDDITVRGAVTAAVEGDRACLRVVEDAGRLVGRALANVCNLLNPDVIVIGGELARAGDLLLDPIRDGIARYALTLTGRSVRIVPSALHEFAGALGATAIALHADRRARGVYRAAPAGQAVESTAVTA